MFGAIEAGGTKIICAIGDEYGNIIKKIRINTELPEESMKKVIDFFEGSEIKSIGVGFFGPININKKSDKYGHVLNTPKNGWTNYDVVGILKKNFNIPIGFDTDVNIACLGEATFGATKGIENSLYITIGTGIGAGAIVNGDLIHGMIHPEMGHIAVTKHPEDTYAGRCQWHNNCFEGLAAGPAIEERWSKKAYEIPEDSVAWDIEAYYICQALRNYILILSPEKIVLGGGVMKQKQLFDKIYKLLPDILGGYVNHANINEDINEYIVWPQLEDESGIKGALALAQIEYELRRGD